MYFHMPGLIEEIRNFELQAHNTEYVFCPGNMTVLLEWPEECAMRQPRSLPTHF